MIVIKKSLSFYKIYPKYLQNRPNRPKRSWRWTGFNAKTLLDQYNKDLLEFEKLSDVASDAGRMLNLAGKRFKPKAKQKVIELSIKIQPYLPFSDFGGVRWV